MNVAIIGSGKVGLALAKAIRQGGHEAVFGLRSPTPGKSDEMSIAEAAARADLSILAVPYGAAADVIAAGGGFAGKVLIDATNPLGLGAGGLGLTVGFDSSGAEKIAALAPKAHVFKAFNQTGFENMADAAKYPGKPVMFVAGDDAAAKPKVLQLVSDCGMEAVDLGGLRNARLLEPLAMLWIELARKGTVGHAFTFAIQRPKP